MMGVTVPIDLRTTTEPYKASRLSEAVGRAYLESHKAGNPITGDFTVRVAEDKFSGIHTVSLIPS